MDTKVEKSAGCIVYKIGSSGRPVFLVVHDVAHGNWGFPKGHIDTSESGKDAAIREVKEEIGLDVEIKNGFEEKINYELKNRRIKAVTYFLGEAKTSKVNYTDGEIDDHRWMSMYEAIGRVTFVNAAMLVQKAKQFLDGKS